MRIDIVKGNEGYCINLINKNEGGQRILGAKPWGNPYNKPVYSFDINKEKLIELRDIFNHYINNIK